MIKSEKMEMFFFLFCIFLYSIHSQYVFSKLHFILWQFMGGNKTLFPPQLTPADSIVEMVFILSCILTSHWALKNPT